ncbi:MAG TPA: hypothetical protein VMU94_11360 [Streptosporangiaceae bacterium]|nr:hypothetical protein [Streptosporangiaceae bacterium]
MTATKAEQARHKELATFAHSQVRRAVLEWVRQTGAEIIRRPVIRGRDDCGALDDAGPVDGLVAARAIELQARKSVRDYCCDAREAGMGWKKIGELLNLELEAERQDISVAEAAYDIAAGPCDSHWAQTYGRSFLWTCGSCGAVIGDEGPERWPGDFRRGHGKGCRRLAAEIRAYNRQAGA